MVDEIKELDILSENSKQDTKRDAEEVRQEKRSAVSTGKVSGSSRYRVVNLTQADWMRLNVGLIALSEKRGAAISKCEFLSEAIKHLLEDNGIDVMSYSKKLFKD